MKNSLINIIGTGLMTLGSVGLLGGYAEAGGNVWKVNPDTRDLGYWLDMGEDLLEQEKKRRERGNENEYGYHSSLPLDVLPRVIFYNEWNDDNNNGFNELHELKGRKEVFYSNERIETASLWNSTKNPELIGKNVSVDILGLDTGKVVYDFYDSKSNPQRIRGPPVVVGDGKNFIVIINMLKEKVGGNRFKFIYNIDNIPYISGDVTIIDAPEK